MFPKSKQNDKNISGFNQGALAHNAIKEKNFFAKTEPQDGKLLISGPIVVQDDVIFALKSTKLKYH